MSKVRFELKNITLRMGRFLEFLDRTRYFPLLSTIHPFNLFLRLIRQNIEVYGGSISRVENLSNRSFLIFLISLPLIGILVWHMGIYFVPLLIIPVLVYLLPVIYILASKMEYLSRLNLELLPFSILLYLNASLGKGLYETFNDVNQSSLFIAFRKEFEIIQRYGIFHGKSFLDGIQRRIKNLRTGLIVKLYSSSLSGQFLGVTMGQRSLEFINDLLGNIRESFNNYVSKASEIVEVIFSIFLLVPLVAIGFQGLSSNNNGEILLIPLLFAPLIYLWISVSQPNMGIHVKIGKLQLVGLLLSTALLALPFNLLLRVGITFLATQLILFPSYLVIKRDESILADFPTILREIGDFTKLGYGIRASIQRINFDELGLHKPTVKFFDNVKKQIGMGNNIYFGSIQNEQVKFIVELLNILDRKGGEGVRVLQELSDMIYSITLSRTKLQRELSTFNILALITPVLFWFSTTSIETISGFSSSTLGLLNLGYSLTLSLLYTKLSKFTFLNPVVYVSVTLISILLSILPPGLIS
ncbi:MULTISPECIES: membrane pilin protein UpsF [Metallosphaera]|uniref:membrane pilin protein UpsF n=3 Tax=Sulfolobaceae TaxID=118883 RepID=UPI001F057BD1|nr:hypothetical protein [Metallosphaera sedula]MCH1770620.1 hypothetical protein [Metallosphaera sedula]MCP6728818.1 hypothetical protein [Metallosphaera sedula]